MSRILTTRVRNVLPPPTLLGHTTEYDLVGGNVVVTNFDYPTYAHLYAARETLTSIGHKSPYKEGGPFEMTRFSIERSTTNKFVDVQRPDKNTSNLLRLAYGGTCIDGYTGTSVPYVVTDSYLKSSYASMASFPGIDLLTYGPKAISLLSPLKPAANLGQFIGELEEGLPQIPGRLFRKAQFFNSLGSEYLNVAFGWKPFVKDLQDMYKTWNSLNSRLAQIVRDNGKPVRRRVTLKREIVNGLPEDQPFAPLRCFPNARGESVDNSDPALINQCKCTKKVSTKEYIWATGRTRYYIPDPTGDEWTQKATNALFGLNLTPSLVYELMPWSWLIDWFSNVGDVISNLSGNGLADLIIDYAYVMRSFKKETSYTTITMPTIMSPWGQDPPVGRFNSVTLTTKIVEERKERIAASPFGFGLQLDDLSVRQFAILTALGLSRQNFLP